MVVSSNYMQEKWIMFKYSGHGVTTQCHKSLKPATNIWSVQFTTFIPNPDSITSTISHTINATICEANTLPALLLSSTNAAHTAATSTVINDDAK